MTLMKSFHGMKNIDKQNFMYITLLIFKTIEIYSDKYTKQTVSFSDGANFLVLYVINIVSKWLYTVNEKSKYIWKKKGKSRMMRIWKSAKLNKGKPH